MAGAIRRLVVFVAIVLAFVACRAKPAVTRDDAKAAPARVVSLSPSTTETIAALHALPILVGRSRYCDYPPEVAALPDVGGYVDPNLEAIVALRPELVVGARGPAGRRIDDTLRSRGIDTYFPPTESIADVLAMVTGLAEKIGRAAEAEPVVARIRAHLASIDAAVAPMTHPRVLLLFGVQPIVAAGPTGFGDELLKRAGALNAVTKGDAYPQLDVEAVAGLDPDVIIDAAVAEEHGAQRISKTAGGWSRVRAVREDRVVPLADEVVLRPGPRVDEGVATLARALHPGQSIP